MPKLWTDTIDTHRRTVRDTILATAAALVAERGLRGVTMSQIAERAGIGRATLYKYFPDVGSMLAAWHARHVEAHLAELAALRERVRADADGLRTVLETYVKLRYARHAHHGDAALFRQLHAAEGLDESTERLFAFMRDLLGEAAEAGAVRTDLPPDELAAYCLHALEAARDLHSAAAVRRLVDVTLDGLRA